jgi:hypothetical protein
MLLKNKLEIKNKWRFIEFVIFFAIVLYLIYSVVVGITLREESFSSYITDYKCQQDRKYKSNFHHVLTVDDNDYSKTLKIDCNSVSFIERAKPVEITVRGNVFLRLSQDGREIFSYNELAADNTGDLYGLILITLLFAILLGYQFTKTFKRVSSNC